MPAIIPAEFWRNAGNHSGRNPAGIPVEYQWNAGNNSGGISAGIPVQYQRNAGNNSGGILAEFWLEFQWNTSRMPAVIPVDSSRIPAESAQNLPGIPGKSGLEFRESPGWNSGSGIAWAGIPGKSGLEFWQRDSTGIPGLFLLGSLTPSGLRFVVSNRVFFCNSC